MDYYLQAKADTPSFCKARVLKSLIRFTHEDEHPGISTIFDASMPEKKADDFLRHSCSATAILCNRENFHELKAMLQQTRLIGADTWVRLRQAFILCVASSMSSGLS